MGRLSSNLTVHAGLCLVGCLHLVAFTSLLFQLPYLYGRHGVQPISTVLESAQSAETQQRLAQTGGSTLAFPSLVWLHASLGLTAEALLAAVCSAGLLLSAAAACGVVHPVVFTLLWALYLSFKSLGGDFLDFGDEVLLEVAFAAIWLAVAHQINKKAQQQQEAAAARQAHDDGPSHPATQHQQLSTVTLMLLKWLLFRLLLVTSTLSATHLCGRDPVLSSCWKTILAHGLPHAATRWLQTLPGPLAAAGAAVTVLELPIAFLVLATAPALQRMTAGALLTLQLLRLPLGSASLANLAAAVLTFLLLDDETWVPMLLGLAKRLRVPVLRSGGDQQEQGLEQGHAGEAEPLSRQSSITSLFGDMNSLPDELGEGALDRLGWAEIAAGLGLVACSGLLLSFSTKLGLLLRPSPPQLLKVLRVAVPVSMLAWFGLAIVACKEAISAALSASKAATAGAAVAADKAAAAAADAGRLAQQSAMQAAQHTPDAGASKQQVEEGPPGRWLRLQASAARPPAPAALLHTEGPLANGVHHEADPPTPVDPAAADSDAHDAEATDDEHGEPSKPKRGRKPAASKAAGAKAGGRASKAAKDAAAAAAAESPRAGVSKARTPAKQQHDKQDPGSHEQPPGSPKPSAGVSGEGAGPSSSRRKAAMPSAAAAVAAARREAAEAAAAQHQQALAAAAAAQKQLQTARLGAWVSTAAAVAVAAAVLAVFVAGAPQLLTAVSHDSAAVSRFFPGPVARLVQAGHSMGLTWASSTARASFRPTQLAAAAAGPGAVVLYEPYVLSNDSSWFRATLQDSLGSRQVRAKGSGMLQSLAGLRGLFQMRLQARMAAAAAGPAAGQDADGRGWLGVLASKIVKGSHDLDGLLDTPVHPHDFVRVNRVAYSPGARRWTAATLEPAAVEGQHRDSLQLASYAESYAAAPGHDGWLVALLESWIKSTSGPLVLLVLLAAVAARHLLLPGGLVQECQGALTAAAAAAAVAAH